MKKSQAETTEVCEIKVDIKPEQTAGYCTLCNKIVPRDKDGNCAEAGHPADFISGLIDLDKDGKVPFQLPKFNWGAALMPPVWGPIHGVLTGALVLPLIVFANRTLITAVELPADTSFLWRGLIWTVTVGIIAGTAYLMYYFGKRGWGIAWNKSAISHTPHVTKEMFDSFIKRERWWTILSLAFFVGFVYLIVAFWVLPLLA